MSDLETRLTAALHADAPPARDTLFRVEVLVRLEQTRFRLGIARIVAAATLLVVLATVNAPSLGEWMTGDGRRLWIVAVASAGACVLPLLPRFRTMAKSIARLPYPYH
jgi:hypothetical protein